MSGLEVAMLGLINDIGVNSHIRMAAHSMFPYYMKSLERPKPDTIARSRPTRPARNKKSQNGDVKEDCASGHR